MASLGRKWARLAPAAVLAAAAPVLLAACSSPAPVQSATALLAQARRVVDTTHSARVTLSSQGAAGASPTVVGAEGDLLRPDSFRGQLTVVQGGLTVNVKVVAVGGVVYVEAPFSSTYTRVDPAAYGFSDPSRILSPDEGVSKLLTASTSAHLGGQDRFQGQILDEVDASLPGSAVSGTLPDAAPTRPVAAVFGIDPSDHQVRRVVLTGPFYRAATNSTFNVVIDHYGEAVSIVAPVPGR